MRKFFQKLASLTAVVSGKRASLSAKVSVALASLFGASVASAEIPAAVQTALDAANTDVTGLAQGVFLIIVVIATYKWFRRGVNG